MESVSKMASPGTEETELTMCDVLQEEKELEEDAKAVLGDSDDTNCTYNDGYVSRQALYACATCTSEGSELGGICLACSYACHENHELIELYTKRNFRCDCGNKAFPNTPCRLCPKKDDRNVENSYNQNFKGVYCSCSRPYPDPTDETPDEMIQCIMCEDWYHGRHLGGSVPDDEDFGEMICLACMSLHPFLYAYKALCDAERIISVDEYKAETSIVKKETASSSGATTIQNGVKIECAGVKIEPSQNGEVVVPAKNTHEQGQQSTAHSDKVVDEVKICRLKSYKPKSKDSEKGPAFMPEGWRKELCCCPECIAMYDKEGCSYLLDDNDTIKAYEDRGKCRDGDESQYDKGLSALSKLDRVRQIEAIHEYNNMKVQLKDYLKPFADAKRTVSVRDIKEFFDGMQQQKRQRVSYVVPQFCR